MANTKISALPAGTPAQTTDVLPIDRSGANYSLTAQDLANVQPTTGTLALARGGTNADLSASGGTTAILAQDASHNITARNLVSGDIPANAEK
jgi:hypothetical protein